jgi:hypothetical protein
MMSDSVGPQSRGPRTQRESERPPFHCVRSLPCHCRGYGTSSRARVRHRDRDDNETPGLASKPPDLTKKTDAQFRCWFVRDILESPNRASPGGRAKTLRCDSSSFADTRLAVSCSRPGCSPHSIAVALRSLHRYTRRCETTRSRSEHNSTAPSESSESTVQPGHSSGLQSHRVHAPSSDSGSAVQIQTKKARDCLKSTVWSD